MARKRTHASTLRSRVVSIRLTDDEYAKRAAEARQAGLTMSSLCEKLVNKGKVDVASDAAHRRMDPVLFAELRRIGNNANQIAHALNSNLPPDVQYAWKTASELLRALGREEMFIQQLAEALRTRPVANDPPAPQTRDVFQRSVQIHSARPRQGHD